MKKSLFALVAGLTVTTSAFAMDVSNPFYIPMKGDFLSETNVSYVNVERGQTEDSVLEEVLSYGITRNFSVNGTIADTWLFDTKGVTGHDRYDNPAWGLGMKYNLIDCCKTNLKVQLGANYDQGGVDHHVKAISAFAKAGYQMGRFLPYLTVTANKPIGEYENKTWLDTRAALNTVLTKNTNLDLGLTYNWDSATHGTGSHASEWIADATLNYVFSDCMSVGLTGEYELRTKPQDVDAYAVGVSFKVAF